MKYKLIYSIFITVLLILFLLSYFAGALGTGYIQIKSDPDLAVFLDGTFQGNTTSEFGGLILQNVPAGSHQIKIVKEKYEPQTVNFNLQENDIYVYEVKPFSPKMEVTQAGEAETDVITQKVGSLQIETVPVDCIIEIPSLGIDSNNKGNKTMKSWTIENIPVGTYQIITKAMGRESRFTVEIKSGGKKHLLVNILSDQVEDLTGVVMGFNIGDTGPSGVGKVFYITDGGLHGLEAAPAGWNGGSEDPESTWDDAAQLCRDYAGGGKKDWFLPSKEELNQLYLNQDVTGGFADHDYWSSSETTAYLARGQYFNYGSQFNYYKYSNFRVRAVRAF